jgi:hypothetical protein
MEGGDVSSLDTTKKGAIAMRKMKMESCPRCQTDNVRVRGFMYRLWMCGVYGTFIGPVLGAGAGLLVGYFAGEQAGMIAGAVVMGITGLAAMMMLFTRQYKCNQCKHGWADGQGIKREPQVAAQA